MDYAGSRNNARVVVNVIQKSYTCDGRYKADDVQCGVVAAVWGGTATAKV